jgi:hypothetical protein
MLSFQGRKNLDNLTFSIKHCQLNNLRKKNILSKTSENQKGLKIKDNDNINPPELGRS